MYQEIIQNGENRITYKGKKNFPLGNNEEMDGTLFEVEKYLNGRSRTAYVFVTNKKPKGTEYTYHGKKLVTATEDLWKPGPGLKPAFDPDAVYENPLFSLGLTGAGGALTYAGMSGLLGISMIGALMGSLGIFLSPFILAYALPLAYRAYHFADRIIKKQDGKIQFVSEKKEKLSKAAQGILNTVENYLLPTGYNNPVPAAAARAAPVAST